MFDVEHEGVMRFGEDADAPARRIFARDLIAKLDKLGVKPGETFIVITPDELERIEGELEQKDDDINALEYDLEQARFEAEDAERLEEAIQDYGRGIVTHAELMDTANAPLLAAA